jgi:hypothetical protein
MSHPTIEAWTSGIHHAKVRSAKSARLRKFSSLHKEQAHRAAYFCELAELIGTLGLRNAFERSALSVEPTHPVPPSRLASQISKLIGSRELGARQSELKLSLLSLSMVAAFAPDSDATKLLEKQFHSPLYLLDPLYGFVYFRQRDGKFHNHCFAIDFWQSRLRSMPIEVASDQWERRSDNMLSGGILAGRLLFSNIVPAESDNVRRSSAPEIAIHSESHLLEIISALQAGATKLPNVQLWFRGQSTDYQVPNRNELIKLGITPYSNIPESDLTPSLYRRYDAFLESVELFERLLLELAQWVDSANRLIPEDPLLSSAFTRSAPHALSSDGLTSFQRGLLLQQYGAPSAYLDITSDPLVAAWFATHRCKQNARGHLSFSRHTWNASDPSSWPTIFVFPLVNGAHPFLELSSILPNSVALRPHRQSCGLLGGAGNLARNYCARYLGLKLRLDPRFALTRPMHTSFLFPPDTEDAALAALKVAGFTSENRLYPLTEALLH